MRRSGADAAETVPLDENPGPEEILLDGFRDYVVDGVEPPFSGPHNLATVGLINALGASSEQGAVLAFGDYMASR